MKSGVLHSLLILLLACPLWARTQNSLPDSLLNLPDDTVKAELIYKAALRTPPENILERIQNHHISIDLSKDINYKSGVIRSYRSLINFLYNHELYVLASDQAIEMLQYCDRKKLKEERASVYTLLGDMYGRQGNYLEAVRYLRLKGEQDLEKEDFKSYANTLYLIAQQHYEHNNYDSALVTSLWSTEIFKRNNMSAEMANALLSTARIYLGKKNLAVAEEKANEAMALYVANANTSGQMHGLEVLGNIFLRTGREDSAAVNYEKALLFADSLNSMTTKRECYRHLAEIYGAQGKFKESYDMQLLYRKTRDVLESDKQVARNKENQIRYELSKSGNRGASQTEAVYESRQKKFIIFLLILVAVLAFMLIKEKTRDDEG